MALKIYLILSGARSAQSKDARPNSSIWCAAIASAENEA
jgi:hypothetical protein